MRACRVFIVASHPLFAQGVEELLGGQPGLQVVGRGAAALNVLDTIHNARPDVVILDADSDAQTTLLPTLLRENLGIKVLGLNLEDNRIDIYYQQQVVGTDVRDLVTAIRSPLEWKGGPGGLRILAIVQGEYGRRIVDNVQRHGPPAWVMEMWPAATALPSMIEDPLEFLPPSLPRADLILSLGESVAVAQLLSGIVQLTGARSVIVAVENYNWLPHGLMNQVRSWLADEGVTAVFPKPLCSLTETSYNIDQLRIKYKDRRIAEFARHFGQPKFEVKVDPNSPVIQSVQATRDTGCGCGRHVATNLQGVPLDQAIAKTGILHHHYPCLASMTMDPDYNDGLMNVSGHIAQRAIREQIEAVSSFESIVPETQWSGM